MISDCIKCISDRTPSGRSCSGKLSQYNHRVGQPRKGSVMEGLHIGHRRGEPVRVTLTFGGQIPLQKRLEVSEFSGEGMVSPLMANSGNRADSFMAIRCSRTICGSVPLARQPSNVTTGLDHGTVHRALRRLKSEPSRLYVLRGPRLPRSDGTLCTGGSASRI